MSFEAFADAKERVRQAIDIVDLVGSYLDLRPQGSDYVAHCPWHDDAHPSLRVSRRRQTWRCWVCNIGGDIFSFVMRREGVDFREALEMLAERAGVELPRPGGGRIEPGTPQDKRTLFRAAAWVEQQYHHCLLAMPEAEPARRYLADRGISRTSIERYRLGFSPPVWQWLLERAAAAGFSPAVLEAIGVLVRSERTGNYYDRFRDRVIFPIRDVQRRTIGFGGRILPAHADAETAKYVNCPETRLYNKSETLFGLDVVRDSVQRSRHLFVMEGYTDAIMAVQHGIEEAVAVCGTALGPRHLPILRRYADRITLVLDGDAAGRRRANELISLFVAADIDVRILTLPEELDPCDFLLRYGAEAFRQLAQKAPDAISHKIRLETEGIEPGRDTHQAHQALERVLQTLAQAPAAEPGSAAALRREQILARLGREFGVALTALRQRFYELCHQRQSRPSSPPPAQSTPRHPMLPAWERELLELLAIEPALVARAAELVPVEVFQAAPAQTIYRACVALWENGRPTSFGEILSQLEDPALQNLWIEIAEVAERKQRHSALSAFEKFSDLLEALDRRVGARHRQQLLQELQEAEDERAVDKLRDLYELARQEKLKEHGD
ncbi:MAG: hypothetical protein KatS3mg110_0097 [Pirellulaceae bacterium]|nr:MAG: hypothetical protein KatS3mg110_0097 [Pirellulaceae bacterium]